MNATGQHHTDQSATITTNHEENTTMTGSTRSIRLMLQEAELLNRDSSIGHLDIDRAEQAIINGEITSAQADTDATDEIERLINAIGVTDGPWWVKP